MLQIEDRPSVTVEQAISILERHSAAHGILFDLDRMLTYQSYFLEKRRPMRNEFRKMAGVSGLKETQTQQVIDVLNNRFQVPAGKMMKDGSASLSAEVRNILLKDPEISEDARHFVQLVSDMKQCSHRISYLETYVSLPVVKNRSFEGHRMTLARPTWARLSTSRISASDPSVQNIYRDFGDIITYQDGEILVRSDSAQIEPRIIYSYYIFDEKIKFYINMYNDAYLGVYHYLFYDDDVIHEMSNEERNKLKTIMNATNYGGSLPTTNPEIAGPFKSKIQNHPKRLELIASIEAQVDRGVETFESAFGTPVTPEETDKYKRGAPGWRNHLVRCGMNNPVQTTASDLNNEGIYMTDQILTTCSKRGKSYIGYGKHDEIMSYISEDDSHLIEMVGECVAFQVRDWLPIHSEVTLGLKKGYVM